MILTRIIPAKDGFSQIQISPRLALMYRALKRPGKGGRVDRLQCGYFGFDTEEAAISFTGRVQKKHKARVFPREAERLVECAWEVKVWEFDGLLDLVLLCAAKSSGVRHVAA